jgi:hypothetical protein
MPVRSSSVAPASPEETKNVMPLCNVAKPNYKREKEREQMDCFC